MLVCVTLAQVKSKWPHWLLLPKLAWFDSKFNSENMSNVPEVKASISLAFRVHNPVIEISNYSSLDKLKRVMAFCFRFTQNCRKLPENRMLGALSTAELNNAMPLIKEAQSESFSEEI